MKKTILVLLLTTMLIATFVNAISLGVAPATLDFKDVLRNKEYTRTISIQRSPDDYDKHYVVALATDTDWISIPENIEIMPGEKDVKVPMTLKVPKKTKLGSYDFELRTRLSNCGGEGIAFCPGINTNIIFDVTNNKNVIGYVDNILTRDSYYGKEWCVTSGVACNGNVPCTFNMHIDTEFGSYWKNFKLDAYSSSTLEICDNIDDVAVGYYHANTKIYIKDGRWKLIKEKIPTFSIFETCVWCQ